MLSPKYTKMREFENNGTTINHHIDGKGEVTLLFVHGAYIDQSYWAAQVDFFKRDYTVVTLDLAGHGKSGRSRTDWSIEGLADDIVALIKYHQLEKVILIGHSLGADLNLIAATKFPDPIIGFVVVDNFKNVATPLAPEFQDQVAGIIESLRKDFAGTNEQYARMALVSADTPTAITDRIVADYRNTYEPMGQATMPEFFKLDQLEKDLLPHLKLKIYLINVTYYPTNVEALQKNAVHGFELREIAGTCHYPMIEHPDAFNEALNETIHTIRS